MTIYPIACGNFKLDGGAMFGVVPKSIWNRTNPADANNMIDLGTRSLLIEDGDRLILIDTGLGDKQSEKFFSYYHLWGDHSLDGSLKKAGFHRDEITDVFLTHLHFDHCGGSVAWNRDRSGYEPAFKNAKFWTNAEHWQWATKPNAREKASFLSENLIPLEESGQLHFIASNGKNFIAESPLGFGVHFVDGHTERQMLPHIAYRGRTLVYGADLIPTLGHLPLPYVMGYDTRPLLTLGEKAEFLEKAVKNDWLLFFEHDAHNEICSLQPTERGVRAKEVHGFDQLFTTQ